VPGRTRFPAAREKLQTDDDIQGMEMPFDGRRMIYGGFDIVVNS